MANNKWRLLLTYTTEVAVNGSGLANLWSKSQEPTFLEEDAFRSKEILTDVFRRNLDSIL